MSTDPTVILILSNVSTASIVALLAFATLEIRKERDKDKAAEARADREEADKTWALINDSREHRFADYFADRQFVAQPLQQHAAISMAADQFDELVATIDEPDDAPKLRALSDQSHEDEQAAEENDDHTGAGRWLLATLIRICSDLYDRIADAWQSWRTRDEVGNGDGIGAVLAASGYDLNEQPESDAEAFEIEVAEIREVEGRKRVRGIYRPTCEMPLVVPDPGKIGGRHRITVPTQRDSEVA